MYRNLIIIFCSRVAFFRWEFFSFLFMFLLSNRKKNILQSLLHLFYFFLFLLQRPRCDAASRQRWDLICVNDYLPDCNRGPPDCVPRAYQSTTCTYSCWRYSAKTSDIRQCSDYCWPTFFCFSFRNLAVTQWLIKYNVAF